MQTPSESLKSARESFDKVFFAPLDYLKEKWENSDLETPSIFHPLRNLKKEVEKNSRPTINRHTEDEFINAESALGRTIFGPIPVGHQREFFRDHENLWIWHESWEENGEKKGITVRYEVRKDGVYKKPLGQGYTRIEGAELENFRRALHVYLDLVKKNLYN